jgi:flagellin
MSTVTPERGLDSKTPREGFHAEIRRSKETGNVAFTINTNIASMQAQTYLRQTSDFQSKTINRVTSGLRIVNSGDDAAGLAIANTYRSDQAVLTQGISNANDGLATLQTIDGGISNISKLLDRARTLAAQSASGTFTGSRSVLNSEFQSVLSEIDRQAQSIGMNTGGKFAKVLSVFIGGGRDTSGATTGSAAVDNGSVDVNLATSTVDLQSLGLKGYEARSAVTAGLQASSASSVQNILGDATNTTAAASTTRFYVQGAGFSDANRIALDVNTSGVATTSELATAINAAISAAEGGGTAAASAFTSINLKASVHTATDGSEQISFSSSNGAFQVRAGDRMANALMGNLTTSTSGTAVDSAIAATTTNASFDAAQTVVVRIQGGGLDTAVDLSLNVGGSTINTAVAALKTAMDNNAALKTAGITMDSVTGFTGGGNITFRSSTGESFTVSSVGDYDNLLGLGTWDLDSTSQADYTSISGIAAPTAGATTVKIKVGSNVVTVAFTATAAAATTAAAFNAAVATLGAANLAVLQSAGIVADASTNFTIKSTNSTKFEVAESAAAAHLGFDSGTGAATSSAAFSAGLAASTANNVASVESAGAYQATSTGDADGEFYGFNTIAYGTGDQTVTVTAVDPSGNKSAVAIVLANNSLVSSANTGRTVDEAVAAINTALQASNDSSLQKIVAVKDHDGAGTEGIRFIGSLANFEVSIGSTANAQGLVNESGVQGVSYSSDQIGTGANVDISTQAGAKSAVTALAEAVTILGESQAVVGKGENQFNFAVSLASTQVTNLAASESAIRDADLASEAANLTKAQILIQAGVAALAQANSAPQAVLSLLKQG